MSRKERGREEERSRLSSLDVSRAIRIFMAARFSPSRPHSPLPPPRASGDVDPEIGMPSTTTSALDHPRGKFALRANTLPSISLSTSGVGWSLYTPTRSRDETRSRKKRKRKKKRKKEQDRVRRRLISSLICDSFAR